MFLAPRAASFTGWVDPVGHPLKEAGKQAGARVRVVDEGVGLLHSRALILEVAGKVLRDAVSMFQGIH
jgi:hypothetical protein